MCSKSIQGDRADILARVIARYLSKYIPGTPTVVPQGMPGGGSITMMNHLYNVAEKDGTSMGIVVGGIYMRHLLDARGIRVLVVDADRPFVLRHLPLSSNSGSPAPPRSGGTSPRCR